MTSLAQGTSASIRELPPRLTRFFTKFPPKVTVQSAIPQPNAPPLGTLEGAKVGASKRALQQRLAHHPISDPNHNPFLPWKNPITGRWRGAMYGLRKQAELCKIARQYGVENLLPWSRKNSNVREARKHLGLRVRGTGVGQQVKGHTWERGMISKMEERRKAMESMPEMIKQWKLVSFMF